MGFDNINFNQPGGFDGQQGLSDNWQEGWSLQESNGSSGNIDSIDKGGALTLTQGSGKTPNAKHGRQEVHQKGDQQWTRGNEVNAMSATFDNQQTSTGVISQLFATGKGPAVQVIKKSDNQIEVKIFENGAGGKGTNSSKVESITIDPSAPLSVSIAVQEDEVVVDVNGNQVTGSLEKYEEGQKFSFKAGIYGSKEGAGAKAVITDLDLIKNGANEGFAGDSGIDWQSDGPSTRGGAGGSGMENEDGDNLSAFGGKLKYNSATGQATYNGEDVQFVWGTDYVIKSDGTVINTSTGETVGTSSTFTEGGTQYTVQTDGSAVDENGNKKMYGGYSLSSDGTTVIDPYGNEYDPITGQAIKKQDNPS